MYKFPICKRELSRKNKQYTCLNTHSIQQGQQINADPKEASKQPFIFTIKENKLIANNNTVFDFKNEKRANVFVFKFRVYVTINT